MVGVVVGWLTPTGAPWVIAVHDTLFRRIGRHVHGAFWAYDGSRMVAAGQDKLSRGTTFVVAAVVVAAVVVGLPFYHVRSCCRCCFGGGVLAARRKPPTGPLPRHAALWDVHPEHDQALRLRRRGTRLAVERTAPFGMLTPSLVIIWCHLAGHSPRVVDEHRQRARWYTTKTHPSYQDMITKLRRVLIAA